MIDLIVKDLVKSFDADDNILDGLSFEVQAGERVGIMGRNGAGKTTLFRILTGEIGCDSGEVTFAPGKKVGLISQIPNYPADYTVEQVLRTAFRELEKWKAQLSQLEAQMGEQPDRAVLALFLLLTGVCGGVILVQGIRILSSVSDGTPFLPQNAVYLRRAARPCFLITAGAAGRTLFTLCREGVSALLSYTALFVPVSIMFGLLFLVMSALFHRAAELKAENDLTI